MVRRFGIGIAVVLVILLIACWPIGVFGGNVRVVDPGRVYRSATITGVSLFLHNVVGFGLATTVAGLLVDHMKVVGIQHPYTVALVVIACFPAMGAPFALLVGRPGNGGPLGAPIHDAA